MVLTRRAAIVSRLMFDCPMFFLVAKKIVAPWLLMLLSLCKPCANRQLPIKPSVHMLSCVMQRHPNDDTSAPLASVADHAIAHSAVQQALVFCDASHRGSSSQPGKEGIAYESPHSRLDSFVVHDVHLLRPMPQRRQLY